MTSTMRTWAIVHLCLFVTTFCVGLIAIVIWPLLVIAIPLSLATGAAAVTLSIIVIMRSQPPQVRSWQPGWWQATDGRWYPPEMHP